MSKSVIDVWLETTASLSCLSGHYRNLARLRSTVIHLLMQVATMTALFKVVAFPLYNRQLMDSFTVWLLDQYKGANLLRATPPQHPLTLRVSVWLDSVSCQALRHFHLLLTTTFAFIEYLIHTLAVRECVPSVASIPFEDKNTTHSLYPFACGYLEYSSRNLPFDTFAKTEKHTRLQPRVYSLHLRVLSKTVASTTHLRWEQMIGVTQHLLS